MGGVLYKINSSGLFGEVYTKSESHVSLTIITKGTDATCDELHTVLKRKTTKYKKPDSIFKLGELVVYNGTIDRVSRVRMEKSGEFFCYSLVVNKKWVPEFELQSVEKGGC